MRITSTILPEKGDAPRGRPAFLPHIEVPVLIFLLSGILAVRIEPMATRAAERVIVESRMHETRIGEIRAELANVQMDLMIVLETDPAASNRLRRQEERLKYSLRAELIRRDERAQSGGREPGTPRS